MSFFNHAPYFIQAPLAGISAAPFRLLTWQQSEPTYTCTEMISCHTLLKQPKDARARYTKIFPGEGPVCLQLSGNNPQLLADAVKIASEEGASLIDLNCGCPVKKIRQKGAGSRLLSDPVLLQKLIETMKKNTTLPVTIKIRVQSRFDDLLNQDILKAVQDGGADALIVHGRHWTEHYETPVHYDQIAYFAENLTIPVIGNGDIHSLASLKKMLNTGCRGVMIGRAGVGQPWLIKALRAMLTDQTFHPPTLTAIGGFFLTHVQGLIDLLQNERAAIYQSRQFAKYYARTLPAKEAFLQHIHQIEHKEKLDKLVAEFFDIHNSDVYLNNFV